MNIKSLVRLTIVGIFALTSVAYGAVCSQNSCTAKITRLYVNASDTNGGVIWVQLDVTSTDITALNCSMVEGVFFTLHTAGNSNVQAMYATLLAAAHSGIPVDLRLADNSPDCEIWYLTESFP